MWRHRRAPLTPLPTHSYWLVSGAFVFGYVFYLPIAVFVAASTLLVFMACSRLMAWVRSHEASDKKAAEAHDRALEGAGGCGYLRTWCSGLGVIPTLRGQLREVLWWFDEGGGAGAREDLIMGVILAPLTAPWLLANWLRGRQRNRTDRVGTSSGVGIFFFLEFLELFVFLLFIPVVLSLIPLSIAYACLTGRPFQLGKDPDQELFRRTIFPLNDVLSVVVVAFAGLTFSPFVVSSTLTAFYTYSGPGDAAFDTFLAEYYRHTFSVFTGGLSFALPSFEFDPSVLFHLSFYYDLLAGEQGHCFDSPAWALP